MVEHAVVIAGGGPTGMMLAAELTLAGIDVVIVERRASFRARKLALARSALPHHRSARSAWRRRSLPRRGEGDAGAGVRRGPDGHQRLPHPPQLRDGAVAEPLRAHPGRLDRRAGRAHPARARGDGFRAGRRAASTSRCPTAHRCGRTIWSVATGAAALCARRPASTSRAGIRPRAGSSPRSRWRRCRSSACVAVVASARPKKDGWASP